ncbi:LPS-assembly protein LptD [bacterium BMS3Abin03]|nr:LPS-assembly protein LptD [bacterium BMS3Abin03]
MIVNHKLLIILLLLTGFVFAQERSESIKIVGDSLIGKVVNGESIREVHGHVVLTQGNVTITCDHAIQYIAKNNAKLKGNVIVRQDSLTITTEEGFYFGDRRVTKSTAGIILDDRKIVLTADSGEYFFNEDKAIFQSDVTLFDSLTIMFADQLIYLRDDDRSIATGNVKIIDENSVITADSLDHYRNTKTSFADGHVKIISLENNTSIYSNHLEDYSEEKYTLINVNPVLVQLDSIYNEEGELEIDTLMISAKIMEAFRDTANVFKATDSVKIIRGTFASVNDYTLYLRDDDIIITEKVNEDAAQPILWYENSQLTGDSITIYIEEKRIKRLDVVNNAFMLSQSKLYPERFDQTSSKDIKISFKNNKIHQAKFLGTVHSIYYLYEDNEVNGLTKFSAINATIIFEDNEVSEVRLYGSPTSEYYPEKQVVGDEKSFTLPKFRFFNNRPNRKELIKLIW